LTPGLLRVATLFVALGAAGCGANQDAGLDAWLRIDGAQFFRGREPLATDGPAVSSFVVTSGRVLAGMRGKPVSGLVPRVTRAVALSLDGDRGWWLITPGAVDPQTLDQLGFSARLSFSPTLPAGRYSLIARAVDEKGRFGPPAEADLMTASQTPDGARLVVTLSWDTQADLDLHLVTPSGVDVWAKKINSVDPPVPGSPGDPNAWMTGVILDFDSNANCQIDGRRQEDAYAMTPPSGHYIARVDTFSLCGEAQADWRVTATLDGNALGDARGFSLPTDPTFKHEAGAGVTALSFDVP
jgi:hypothetical protein